MSSHSAAHYFLEGLVDLGIDYIFANLGTDHVSLIEALAQWDKQGRKHPEVILCPHEIVAVHMAAGYALATGRAQAVFVHVDAGTANACMAVQNLFRYRLPVLLFAGRAPYTLHGELPGSRDTYVHFVQDPFDIAKSSGLTSNGSIPCHRASWSRRRSHAPALLHTAIRRVRFI